MCKKLLHKVSTELITNPFIYEESDALLNLATRMVMPADEASLLLDAYDEGAVQMTEFVEQWLNSNNVSFWNPIPNLKVKTFASTAKKQRVKASAEKVITVSADRDLLNRLVIAAKARNVNLKDLPCYELSTIPFSTTHIDGTLRKTNKSILLGELHNKGDVQPKLSLPPPDVSTAYIIDGMAVIQMVKSGGAATFGELASTHYNTLTSSLGQNGCCRVDVVFDRYLPTSIKAGERSKQGESCALEVKIQGSQTPIPKQWQKYIGNPENKKNPCDFLVKTWTHMGQDLLPEGPPTSDWWWSQR